MTYTHNLSPFPIGSRYGSLLLLLLLLLLPVRFLQVGSNGYLTFEYGETSYDAEETAFVGAKMIAPYWSDIDLRVYQNISYFPKQHIWYRETREQRFLDKVLEKSLFMCMYLLWNSYRYTLQMINTLTIKR